MAPVLIDLQSFGATEPLLKLNNDHARELSHLSSVRFQQLIEAAFLACRVGEADALLLCFDQDACYDSPNFMWFREHYDRFVYVDRVVVDAPRRGRGLARALYGELFARARAAGHTRVVCEINSHPPNPGSDIFHQQLGFAVVGEALLPDSGKRVRYFARTLSAH